MHLRLRLLVSLLACCTIAAQGCAGRDSAAGVPPLRGTEAAIRQTTSLRTIAPPLNTWTWIDVPQTNCDDGSQTGFAVNPGPGPDLVVFFDAGGACWDATSCLTQNLAQHGPIGKTQFDAAVPKFHGGILDRTLPGNPLATATLVFIPYCTGDLHAGSNVVTYTDAKGVAHRYHHTGYQNSLADLNRIATMWPLPRKLIIAGSSAGGFGALLNFQAYRMRLPAAEAYLIDDSGPPLPNGAIPAAVQTDLYQNWRLDVATNHLCNCRYGFEPALATLLQRYPNDRMSLLESEQDGTMRAYFQMTAQQFQADLDETADDAIDGSRSGRYFIVSGHTHMMLPAPTAFTEHLPLLTWLHDQITDARAWQDESPST